jgi:hypothetical protein
VFRFVLSLLFFCTSLVAEEVHEVVHRGLKEQIAVFENVAVDAHGPTDFSVLLGDAVATVKTVEGTMVYDGFRFVVPAKIPSGYFVWYFTVSQDWANWYIVPSQGQIAEAFRHWHTPDALYHGLDTAIDAGNHRSLQSLTTSYFIPGKEYIIWFRRVRDNPGTSTVRGRLAWVASQDSLEEASRWKVEDYEKHLNLAWADQRTQTEFLNSTG